jgi:hypothetical protein
LARISVDNLADFNRPPDGLIQISWNFPIDFLDVFGSIKHVALAPLSWPVLQTPLPTASRVDMSSLFSAGIGAGTPVPVLLIESG